MHGRGSHRHSQHEHAISTFRYIISASQCVQYLETAAPLHVLEHVASGSVLHRNGKMLGSEEDLLELDDMRVAEVAMADDLALDMLRDLVTAL